LNTLTPLDRLRLVRQQLAREFPVPEAARRTGNPEYEALKAEELDAEIAVRDER
jgi:hypothetical protein